MLKLVDLPDNAVLEPGMRGRLLLVSDGTRMVRHFLLPYGDTLDFRADGAGPATILESRDVVLQREHPSGRWWVRVT
jgi:hypothetical protein